MEVGYISLLLSIDGRTGSMWQLGKNVIGSIPTRGTAREAKTKTGITVYLMNGGLLEHAQQMATHESAPTTKLYDRRSDNVTLGCSLREHIGPDTN